MHPFEALTGRDARFPEDWYQGRASFGGLTAGAMVRALCGLVDRPLQSVTISLTAPARGEARVEAGITRVGRTLTHAWARIEGLGEARAVLGEPREHPVAWQRLEMPAVPPPEAVEATDMEERGGPAFTRHFEYRYVGPVPMSGGVPSTAVWMRPRPAMVPDAAMVVALLDAGPPPVLVPLTAPRMLSTVELRVRLHLLPTDNDFLLLTARTDTVGAGWADEVAHLWARDGQLIAECQQLIAIF